MYRFARRGQNKSVWRCIKEKSLSCKGRLWELDSGERRVVQEHGHAPDPAEVKAREVINRIKDKSRAGNATPSYIVASEVAALEPGTAASLPPYAQLKRIVGRSRGKQMPSCPTNLKDLIIPEELKTDHRGELFLQYDSRSVSDEESFSEEESDSERERILIFASKQGLRALARSQVWLMDGTFKVVPSLFYQLYTVNILKEGVTMPMVYCLMSSKTNSTYTEFLSVLNNLVIEAHSRLELEIGIIDFELAFITAFSDTFRGTRIQGCYFHFSQALWRKIQKIPSLRALYSAESSCVLHVKMLISLAFVSPGHVYDYYETLIVSDYFVEKRDCFETFLLYFEKNWVGQLGERRDPRFAIDMWNCFENTLLTLPVTNNAVEGWHRGFQSLLVSPHPTLWKLIESLKKNNAVNVLRICQVNSSLESQNQRSSYKSRHELLRETVGRFEKLDRLDYLEAIARHIIL